VSGATSNTEGSDGGNRVRIEQRLLIHFLAKKEFWAKLEEVKALLSNKIPGGTFEEVFEVLMNEFIDRHSPEKRTQRREKRQAMRLDTQPSDRSYQAVCAGRTKHAFKPSLVMRKTQPA